MDHIPLGTRSTIGGPKFLWELGGADNHTVDEFRHLGAHEILVGIILKGDAMNDLRYAPDKLYTLHELVGSRIARGIDEAPFQLLRKPRMLVQSTAVLNA